MPTLHEAGAQLGTHLNNILAPPSGYLVLLTTKREWSITSNATEPSIVSWLRAMKNGSVRFDPDPIIPVDLGCGWIISIAQGNHMGMWSNLSRGSRKRVLKSCLDSAEASAKVTEGPLQ